MSKAAVTPVGLEFAPAVAELLAAVMEPAWSPESVAGFMGTPGAIALLAVPEEPGAAPVGFLLARVAADEAELAAMGVAARWRGRGIGRALLEKALEMAGAAGATRMFLEVAENNRAALALYEALGFRGVGRRPGYYGTGRGDALLMARALGSAMS